MVVEMIIYGHKLESNRTVGGICLSESNLLILLPALPPHKRLRRRRHPSSLRHIFHFGPYNFQPLFLFNLHNFQIIIIIIIFRLRTRDKILQSRILRVKLEPMESLCNDLSRVTPNEKRVKTCFDKSLPML